VSLVGQLTLLATRVATEIKAVRAEMAAISGTATPVKASALPDITGQTLALGDNFIVRDLSNTLQNATTGSLSELSTPELFASLRKLFQNASTARVINGSGAADTYLTGSNIALPSTTFPLVGTEYRCRFDVTKTAVGTATPIITVRIGTAGTTADAAILTFTFGAGTAAIDTGLFEVRVKFRTVGSGTAAVVVGTATLISNLTTTGLSNAVKARAAVSSGFNSTTAGLIIGVSYNGGATAVHTVEQVTSELIL
jgi:hypothetical protein